MTSHPHYFRVLSIAGSDSGGGAGIQADLKTISALGCYGMTAIAALTAQNSMGVTAIHAVPPDFLAAQLEAVLSDIGVDAIKIGMLHSPEIVGVVYDALLKFGLEKQNRIVLDPVMVSTSGAKLMEDATIKGLVARLFPLSRVITPNLDEAAVLLGRKISDETDLESAAKELLDLGAPAVLLKGGHLKGREVVDVLAMREADQSVRYWRFSSPRIESGNLHGTGCTLSSAIACFLAQGQALPEAVESARAYILQAITAGVSCRTGKGHGPLNHGFSPLPMKIKNILP